MATTTTTNPSTTTPDDPTTPANELANHHYFKELKLCDLIWQQPYRVFTQNWSCFLTIALFASGLRCLLAFVFDVVNGPNYGADYGTEADVSGFDYNVDNMYDDNSESGFDWATFTMSLVDSIILYVVLCLADGATVQVVSEMYAGQTHGKFVGAFDALGKAAYKAVPLVGSCLLISTALTVVLLCLMPIAYGERPGGLFLIVLVWFALAVYVSLITFVTYPAIVVEHKGIIDSIRRSIRMTQGHLGQILVVLIVYSLFKAGLSILVVATTIAYDAHGSKPAFYTRCVLSFAVNTFFIALRSILKSVIYFNIRITDEQLSQDKLLQEMGLLNAYTQMDNDNAENNSNNHKAIEMETPTTETDTTKVMADKEVV